MQNRRLVIAAYDISSQRRLKHALRHCTAYAGGGQKSLHECWVTGGERAALSVGLAKICRTGADAWLVADLGVNPKVMTLGRGRQAPRPRSILFMG